MRTRLLIITVFVCFCLSKTNGQNLFNKNYVNTDGSGNWIAYNLILNDSLYIINGGYSVLRENCSSYWSRGTFLVSIDTAGNLINKKHFSDCEKRIYEGSRRSIVLSPNQDLIYSCGVVFYNDVPISSDYLAVFDFNLDTLSFFEYNLDTTSKRVYSLCNSKDNCLVLAGASDSTFNELVGFPDTTYSKSYLCKLSLQGQTIWAKSYSFGNISDGCWSTFYHVINTYDNGYLMAGRTSDFGNSRNLIMKTDSLGIQKWVRFYGNLNYGNPSFSDLIETYDSCYIVCGAYTYGETGGGLYPYDGWLIKLDKDGNEKWNRKHRDYVYGSTDWRDTIYSFYYGLVEKPNHDILAICGTRSDDEHNYIGERFRLRCLDSIGNKKWDKVFTSVGNQQGPLWPNSIRLTDDGGIAIAGWGEIYYWNEQNQWTSDQRIFLIKTDSLGNDVETTIRPVAAQPISKFELVCYPNPASGEFWVDLPEENNGDVLEIYATNGSLVYEQPATPGVNRVDLCGVRPGMYLARLREAGMFGKIIIE